MSQPDDARKRDDETPDGLTALPDADDDFADEHSEPPFADEQAGGPEAAAEDDSPRGLSGED